MSERIVSEYPAHVSAEQVEEAERVMGEAGPPEPERAWRDRPLDVVAGAGLALAGAGYLIGIAVWLGRWL